MRILLVTLLLALPVFGDELLLKDGTRINWVSLKSKGDTYEVETRDGKQTTVRKADVERISTAKIPDIVPLTGATFVKEKRKIASVDLLQTIDLKRDVQTGQWKLVKGVLAGTHEGTNNSKFQFKSQPLEEYDLSLTVERKAGAGDFVIGLVGGGSEKQFEIILDGATGRSGVWTADGWKDEFATVPGAVLTLGVPRKITVMVRKTGILIRVDDKDLAVWTGDWATLTVPPVHAVTSKDSLFLACFNGTYEVSRAVVQTAK